MDTPIRVYIDGVEDTTRKVSWEGLQFEEVLGGVGSCTLTMQDRGNTSFDPQPHQDVKITIRTSGWVLFRGEIMSVGLDIPFATSGAYRQWTLQCRDYNGQLSERLMGAPNGDQWWSPGGTVAPVAVDPGAISGGTDKGTVQNWFRDYFKYPDGTSADTTTYVGEYVPNSFIGQPENILWLYTATTTMQAALETLASMADVNVQGWLMPDQKLAWLAIPTWTDLIAGGSAGLLPSAPVDLGTGGTQILSLRLTKDGGAMPQAVYVQGATTYVQSEFGLGVTGGSGWYAGTPALTQRQAYLGSPGSRTEAQRDRIGDSALRRAASPTLRGSMRVQGVDGWRAGQVVTVTNTFLPSSMQNGSGQGRFVIQRVSASLYPGTDVREYTLDFGDGPAGRISQYGGGGDPYATVQVGPLATPPMTTFVVDWVDFGPIGQNETRDFTVTPATTKGELRPGLPAMPITFTVAATDTDGNLVTGEGSVDPETTTTDLDGKARGTLHTSETRDDLYYEIVVKSPVLPA